MEGVRIGEITPSNYPRLWGEWRLRENGGRGPMISVGPRRNRGQSIDSPDDPLFNPNRGVRFRISDSIYTQPGGVGVNQIRPILRLD